jgi:hypothetical protein
MNKQGSRQHGFGHIGLIAGVGVAVAVVLMGIMVWKNQFHANASVELKDALASAECSSADDKELCMFFISTKAQKFTTINFTEYSEGRFNQGSYETDNDERYRLATETATSRYEVIGVGAMLYSRDPDSDAWWRQEIRGSDIKKYNLAPGTGVTFTEENDAAQKIVYRKQDTQACPTTSRLTCLKYQMNDPGAPGVVRFVWFDTEFFQLQRLKSLDGNDSSDATFGYGKVSIGAPDNTRDLPANQYIVPGQADPVIVPDGGLDQNIEDLMGR